MSGYLTSIRERALPALVSVDGHLLLGWGTIDVGDRRYAAYKITPGDLTRPPDAAIRLSSYLCSYHNLVMDHIMPPACYTPIVIWRCIKQLNTEPLV